MERHVHFSPDVYTEPENETETEIDTELETNTDNEIKNKIKLKKKFKPNIISFYDEVYIPNYNRILNDQEKVELNPILNKIRKKFDDIDIDGIIENIIYFIHFNDIFPNNKNIMISNDKILFYSDNWHIITNNNYKNFLDQLKKNILIFIDKCLKIKYDTGYITTRIFALDMKQIRKKYLRKNNQINNKTMELYEILKICIDIHFEKFYDNFEETLKLFNM